MFIILVLTGKTNNIPGKLSVIRKVPFTEKAQSSPTASILPTDSNLPEIGSRKEANIVLESGFGFNLPNSWSATITDQSKEHFFGKFYLDKNTKDKTYIEIESIVKQNYFDNPLLLVEKSEKKKINGLVADFREGKEQFKSSNRLFKQVVIQNNSSIISATHFYTPQLNNLTAFDELIKTISGASNQTYNNAFIPYTFADEAVAGVPKDAFVRIEVMGKPLPERITKSDRAYKDGFAKFYRFDAIKGQRLTAVAMEDSGGRSFIKTELYDEQGNQLYNMDTRIEFTAPYTGTYYYIVDSFGQQEGPYLMKVFDRDQTENLIYVKFEDGSERLLDYNFYPPLYGEKEVAIVMQFVNPIEVMNEQSAIRYFDEPKEFEPGRGLISVGIWIYAKQESYKQWTDAGYPEPDEDETYRVPIKLTPLAPSRMIIEKTDGSLFPINHHIKIRGWTRFFTESQ